VIFSIGQNSLFWAGHSLDMALLWVSAAVGAVSRPGHTGVAGKPATAVVPRQAAQAPGAWLGTSAGRCLQHPPATPRVEWASSLNLTNSGVAKAAPVFRFH
jgi:hypothetical protein